MTHKQEQRIWNEGYFAYTNGSTDAACPYSRDAECQAWIDGYNAAMKKDECK